MVDEGLVARLLHRREIVFDPAVGEAVAAGAEEELLEALRGAAGFTRVVLAAALGDLRRPGPADALLRELVRTAGPRTQDLRSAALVALAKRLGPAATDDFREALSTKDGGVRGYALACLAAVGDDRAWPDVLVWLRTARPARVFGHTPLACAVIYLARGLEARGAEDRQALVALLRRRWSVLVQDGAASELDNWWPEVAPDGPAEPGPPGELPRLAEEPLFASSG